MIISNRLTLLAKEIEYINTNMRNMDQGDRICSMDVDVDIFYCLWTMRLEIEEYTIFIMKVVLWCSPHEKKACYLGKIM